MGRDDLIGRSIELALFLLREREPALRAATEALARLEVVASAQDKRRYYSPVGRRAAGATRPARTRVSLSKLQLLQRLLYREAEVWEREQERSSPGPSDEAMVIRFVKHLVRITLRRNAFYVVLGVSRLLYGYSTEEVMRVYELLVYDPERFKDAAYYRSRKARLLAEVRQRFDDQIATVRGAGGEVAFEPCSDSARWARLVEECLRRFTPWGSLCRLPAEFDASGAHTPFRFSGDHPDDEHPLEVDRMHAVLHPPCFVRLTRALGLDKPQRRLTVPRFYLARDREGGDGDARGPDDTGPPAFGDRERLEVARELARREELRRRLVGRLLRVVVDGVERCRLDLDRDRRAAFVVEADAELVEVYALGRDGEVLIAVYSLPGPETAERAAILLEGGQEVAFHAVPAVPGHGEAANGEVRSWHIEVTYRETRMVRAVVAALRRLRRRWQGGLLLRPAWVFVLLVTLGGAVAWWLAVERALPPAVDFGAPPEGRTRGEPDRRPAVSLAELRSIYVAPLGDAPWQRQLRDQLRAAGLAAGVELAATPAAADAVLKPVASGAGEPTVTVQLVNRRGEVLWTAVCNAATDSCGERLQAALADRAR